MESTFIIVKTKVLLAHMKNRRSKMVSKIDSYENELEIKQHPFQQNVEQDDYADMGNVYFAFIDVLGFKYTYESMMHVTGNENKVDKEDPYKKFRDVFNYFFELMNATEFIQKDKDTYAGQTSDSLYFYTKKQRIDYLVEFIKIFILFNQYAMSKNVFFRGGIAHGTLTRNKRYQFYGDSVIKAYLLESVIASNPVIYIDTKTRSEILSYLRKDEDFTEETSFIDHDNNKRYYIKPFYQIHKEDIINNFQGNVNLREYKLADIHKVILRNKEIFEYYPKTFCKYTFLETIINNLIEKE